MIADNERLLPNGVVEADEDLLIRYGEGCCFSLVGTAYTLMAMFYRSFQAAIAKHEAVQRGQDTLVVTDPALESLRLLKQVIFSASAADDDRSSICEDLYACRLAGRSQLVLSCITAISQRPQLAIPRL